MGFDVTIAAIRRLAGGQYRSLLTGKGSEWGGPCSHGVLCVQTVTVPQHLHSVFWRLPSSYGHTYASRMNHCAEESILHLGWGKRWAGGVCGVGAGNGGQLKLM